jgi:hypothetical protein
MASQVAICNIVLVRIGAETIASINQGSAEANTLKAVYDHCLEQTIIEGSWPETYYTRELAPLDETPINGFDYAYLLPENPKFLGALELIDATSEYLTENGKIYSDDSTITIRYKCLIDTESAGPLMQKALIAKLIYSMSKYAGVDLLQVADQEYRAAIIQGRKLTDKQRTPKNKSNFNKANILRVR